MADAEDRGIRSHVAFRIEGGPGGPPFDGGGNQAGKVPNLFGPACTTSGGQPLAKSLKLSM